MSAAPMDTLPPRLAAAVAQLQDSLRTPSPARCWGCNHTRLTVGAWAVAAYVPRNPTHPPIAYLLCPSCATNRAARRRAAQTIETKSRDLSERRGTQ